MWTGFPIQAEGLGSSFMSLELLLGFFVLKVRCPFWELHLSDAPPPLWWSYFSCTCHPSPVQLGIFFWEFVLSVVLSLGKGGWLVLRVDRVMFSFSTLRLLHRYLLTRMTARKCANSSQGLLLSSASLWCVFPETLCWQSWGSAVLRWLWCLVAFFFIIPYRCWYHKGPWALHDHSPHLYILGFMGITLCYVVLL